MQSRKPIAASAPDLAAIRTVTDRPGGITAVSQHTGCDLRTVANCAAALPVSRGSLKLILQAVEAMRANEAGAVA